MTLDIESLIGQAVAGDYGSIHVDSYPDGRCSWFLASRDSRRRSATLEASRADFAAFAEEMHARMTIHERSIATEPLGGGLIVDRGGIRETARARQEIVEGVIHVGAVVAAAQMRVQDGSGARHWVLNIGFTSGAQVKAWINDRLHLIGEFIMRGGEKDSPLFMALEGALDKREDLGSFDLDAWLAARGAGDAIEDRTAHAARAQTSAAERARRMRATPEGTRDFRLRDLTPGFIVRIRPTGELRVVTLVRSDGRVNVSKTGRLTASEPVDAADITHIVLPADHRAFNALHGDRDPFDQVVEMCMLASTIDASGRWGGGAAALAALRALYDDMRYGPER